MHKEFAKANGKERVRWLRGLYRRRAKYCREQEAYMRQQAAIECDPEAKRTALAVADFTAARAEHFERQAKIFGPFGRLYVLIGALRSA